MPRRKKTKVPSSAADVADIVRSNPYVKSVIEDAKLRKNLRTAVNSGKSAYGRVSNGKVAPRSLLEDKKLHNDIGKTLTAARDATITLTRAQRRRVRRGLTFGRVLIFGAVGSGAALAASEGLRSKVLDLLFGAEEEFQYTPPSNSGTAQSTSTVGAA